MACERTNFTFLQINFFKLENIGVGKTINRDPIAEIRISALYFLLPILLIKFWCLSNGMCNKNDFIFLI